MLQITQRPVRPQWPTVSGKYKTLFDYWCIKEEGSKEGYITLLTPQWSQLCQGCVFALVAKVHHVLFPAFRSSWHIRIHVLSAHPVTVTSSVSAWIQRPALAFQVYPSMSQPGSALASGILVWPGGATGERKIAGGEGAKRGFECERYWLVLIYSWTSCEKL